MKMKNARFPANEETLSLYVTYSSIYITAACATVLVILLSEIHTCIHTESHYPQEKTTHNPSARKARTGQSLTTLCSEMASSPTP
jgi:hypothetical protein